MEKALTLKFEKGECSLIDDNIVENSVYPHSHLEKEDMFTLKKLNVELTEGKPYAILVNSGVNTSISDEARKLIATRDFAQNTIAKALFVESLAHKIVGNFYLKVNRPYVKTQVFTDREKAIEWLKEQMKMNRK